MSYQPSATPSAPPSATLIVDFPSEDQPFQEEFPADPQTPGGHDFQNAPIPYEEKNRMPRINKGACVCECVCEECVFYMYVYMCVCKWR